MIILGMDTSGSQASVAIAQEKKIAYQCESHRPLSHSEVLSPLVQDALRMVHGSLTDVSCAGIAIGPGSFTGLRVGIGFLMGLCLPCRIPVVPLSSLELLAFASGWTGSPIRPIRNAQRGDVFTALFSRTPRGWQRLEEDRVTPVGEIDFQEPVLRIVSGTPVLPAGTVFLRGEGQNTATAAAILAGERITAAVEATALRAQYLRLPAAQEKAIAKSPNG